MTHIRSARRLAVALAAAVTVVAAAGCGGTSDAAKPKNTDAPAPLGAELPAEYRQAGKLVVGADISYAPMEYYDSDGTTVLGFDKDLADAIGKQLGVRMEFRNASFDGLVTALRSSRIDVVMSGMSDTKERQQRVDFVDYYRAGAMLIVRKGNPEGLKSIADLCGRTVAVQRATTQEGYAQEQSAKCAKSGGQPIQILSFDRETEALLQVKQGRAAAGLEDYPVATYNARTAGGGNDFEVVGEQIGAGPLGIAVAKEQTALRDAIKKALDALVASGDYRKLVEKWNMPAGALTQITINAGS
jgi:polar amino acid transport system substrate-binding protein